MTDKLKETISTLHEILISTQVAYEGILNLIDNQQKELEKKDKIIESYKIECKRFRNFCKNIRKNEKHNVDEFNQGREFAYIQFLNLINGEKNWDYEGTEFIKADKELEDKE